MQINITKFYNEAAPMDYSASVAEIGWNAEEAEAGHCPSNLWLDDSGEVFFSLEN